jgi:hypothetical protein
LVGRFPNYITIIYIYIYIDNLIIFVFDMIVYLRV